MTGFDKNPDYPSLDTASLETVSRYLSSRNFIEPQERLERIDPVTESSRNVIRRVVTDRRSFVVKQFRAWQSDGRPAPASDERFRAESQFYRTARIADCAQSELPRLFLQDTRAGCLIMEDIGRVRPLAGQAIPAATAAQLGWFLVSLHHRSQSVPLCVHYRNPTVVGWQMMRLFPHTVCCAQSTSRRWLVQLRDGDDEVRYALEDALSALERGGGSLVHGDFSPENWVQNGHGPRVVDGEFSFFGPPEYDAGAFLAGLLRDGQPMETIASGLEVIARGCFRYDQRLVAAFAGVHLCHALERRSDKAAMPRDDATAERCLRRIRQAIETRSLNALVSG